jgi:hypothetical protein
MIFLPVKQGTQCPSPLLYKRLWATKASWSSYLPRISPTHSFKQPPPKSLIEGTSPRTYLLSAHARNALSSHAPPRQPPRRLSAAPPKSSPSPRRSSVPTWHRRARKDLIRTIPTLVSAWDSRGGHAARNKNTARANLVLWHIYIEANPPKGAGRPGNLR